MTLLPKRGRVHRSFADSRRNRAVAMRPMAGLERPAKVDPARRRPDRPTRPQNPLSARSALGMAAVARHRLRGRRDRRARRRGHDGDALRERKSLRETGGDEAAALATAQMLAEAPKDRSADLLFAAALHDPALEIMRSQVPIRSGRSAARIRRRSDIVLARARARRLAFFRGRVCGENNASVPATLAPSCEPTLSSAFPGGCSRPSPWRSRKPVSRSLCCCPCFGWRPPGARRELARLSAGAVRSDQRRPALRPRQAHAPRASSHRALRSRERRDRAVSDRARLRLWRRRGAAHGGLLCRRRADPADLAMATFGRTHSRRRRGRFPQGPCRRRRRRRIGAARRAHIADLNAIRSQLLSRALPPDR